MRTVTLQYPLSMPEPGIPENGLVLAIGEFDGMHLGHREVLSRAAETAGKLGLPAAVMTFDPHPREVLGQDKYVRHITPLPEKLELFAGAGIDIAYIVRFDLAFSRVSPEQFVDDMLMRLKVNTVVVGFDFRFGHKSEGNADTLCRLASGRFAVEVVRPFHMDGVKVSSTLVRDHLERGEVDRVGQLLGRIYALTGKVVHGYERGRLLGFPTANIELDAPYVVPANGVYAIRCEWDGRVYNGVMNVGTKPTFEDDSTVRTLEAHLFDFAATIYDEALRVELVAYIRAEQKFASVDELIAQIGRDVAVAKKLVGHPSEQADNRLPNGT